MKRFIDWLLDSHFPWIVVIKRGVWSSMANYNTFLMYDRIFIKGKPTMFCWLS